MWADLESATGPQKTVAPETEGNLSPAFWAFPTAFRPHTALHLTASSVRSCVALLKPAFHSGPRLTPVMCTLNRSTQDSYTRCHGHTDITRLRVLPVCQSCVA